MLRAGQTVSVGPRAEARFALFASVFRRVPRSLVRTPSVAFIVLLAPTGTNPVLKFQALQARVQAFSLQAHPCRSDLRVPSRL